VVGYYPLDPPPISFRAVGMILYVLELKTSMRKKENDKGTKAFSVVFVYSIMEEALRDLYHTTR
jgi:hypothetical protein